MRAPISSPSPERERESIKRSGKRARTVPRLMGTLTMGASTSIMAPWMMAMVAAPTALPTSTPLRLKGETSTSFRKPNSLSQTMEMPDMIEVISTVMARIPGYMNCI